MQITSANGMITHHGCSYMSRIMRGTDLAREWDLATVQLGHQEVVRNPAKYGCKYICLSVPGVIFILHYYDCRARIWTSKALPTFSR